MCMIELSAFQKQANEPSLFFFLSFQRNFAKILKHFKITGKRVNTDDLNDFPELDLFIIFKGKCGQKLMKQEENHGQKTLRSSLCAFFLL